MTVRIGILLERQMVVSSAVTWNIEVRLYLVSDLLVDIHIGCLLHSGGS